MPSELKAFKAPKLDSEDIKSRYVQLVGTHAEEVLVDTGIPCITGPFKDEHGGDYTIISGTNYSYSVKGTPANVAAAIANAINNIRHQQEKLQQMEFDWKDQCDKIMMRKAMAARVAPQRPGLGVVS